MSFFDRLIEGLKDIGTNIADFTPKLVGALIIIILGWWIAKIVRGFIRRLLNRKPVEKLLDASGIGPALTNAGYSAVDLVANVIYVILLLITFLLASQALGAASLTELIQGLVSYLPLVVAAIIVLVLAGWIGTFLADMVRPAAQSRNMPWAADVARYAVIIFGALTALNVLGVGSISTQVFQFTIGGIAVAFAVAFGVGGIDTARKWWERKLAPRD